MSKSIPIILLLNLLVIVACEKETPTKAAPPMASSVTINPASATLEMIGQTIQLTATVKDQYGELFTSATVSWSSSNPQVATVDDLGLATARNIGSTAVSARVGNTSSSAEIIVRGPAAVAYITQATQSLAHPVPLVAEEPALLRVFFLTIPFIPPFPPFVPDSTAQTRWYIRWMSPAKAGEPSRRRERLPF